jgi:hypothetical protein
MMMMEGRGGEGEDHANVKNVSNYDEDKQFYTFC